MKACYKLLGFRSGCGVGKSRFTYVHCPNAVSITQDVPHNWRLSKTLVGPNNGKFKDKLN